MIEDQDFTQAKAILAALRPAVRAALVGLLADEAPEAESVGGRSFSDSAAKLKDREWLEERYDQVSAVTIAAELGCDEKTVHTWRRRHGIPDKTPSEASRRRNRASLADRRAAAIATLKQWAAEHDGRSPTVAGWQMERPDGALSDKGLRYLFGSWNAVLDAAGLESHGLGWQDPQRTQAQRESQRTAFLEGIRAWAAEHGGEAPTSTEWQSDRPAGAPGAATVRSLFGTWPAAVKAAGLRPLRPGEKKNVYHATTRGSKPGPNRQMVTGKGLQDQRPGTTKHFGRGMRDAA